LFVKNNSLVVIAVSIVINFFFFFTNKKFITTNFLFGITLHELIRSSHDAVDAFRSFGVNWVTQTRGAGALKRKGL
jgi:hypothetical protein